MKQSPILKQTSKREPIISFGNKPTDRRIKVLLLSCLVLLCTNPIYSQQQVLIHSHNDYRQRVPFYQAYSQQVYSIEVDVFAGQNKNELLVAHDMDELPTAPTFDELYLQPLVSLFKRNNNKPWKDSEHNIQLLVELKSAVNPTLDILAAKLVEYPEVFDPSVNPNAVRVTITGNVPQPNDFIKYPLFISFDGSIHNTYTPEQLKRVALISEPFRAYSQWNGKGHLIASEENKLIEVINQAHSMGKPVRFWGSPDNVTTWNTFFTMGIDYINTDRPEACTDFFRDFHKKNFSITSNSNKNEQDITIKTDRLDKTTSSFGGFGKNSLILTSHIPVYKPTYKNDGANKRPKNIILLIGDGMGLSQIYAAETVNKSLSLLQLRFIGLQKTNAKDAFTTDSAGAGSSIATGQSSNNRHIAMSETGEVYPSLTDVLSKQGLACGVVTLGNVADATPAAFYGHSTERDNTDEITVWLTKNNLTLLSGSDMKVLKERKDKRDLIGELSKTYKIVESVNDINKTSGKVICIDEQMGKAATEETLPLLSEATAAAIQKLHKSTSNGFFLMVEGAKIDYAGHANSLPSSVMETLSFDLAVSEALKFADKNGETLVIVTGDHETGGLTLMDGNKEKGHITAIYTTDDHTPIMLPVFAYGPGASRFTGVYPNTQLFSKIHY